MQKKVFIFSANEIKDNLTVFKTDKSYKINSTAKNMDYINHFKIDQRHTLFIPERININAFVLEPVANPFYYFSELKYHDSFSMADNKNGLAFVFSINPKADYLSITISIDKSNIDIIDKIIYAFRFQGFSNDNISFYDDEDNNKVITHFQFSHINKLKNKF